MEIRKALADNIKKTLDEREIFIRSFVEGEFSIAIEQIEDLFRLDEAVYNIGRWKKSEKFKIKDSLFNELSNDYSDKECSIKKSQECLTIYQELFGLYAGYKHHSSHIIDSSASYPEVMLKILEMIDDHPNKYLQIIVHSEQYNLSKDPLYLRALLFTWKRAQLNPFFENDEIKVDALEKKDLTKATNLFSIASFTLLQAFEKRHLDDQFRTMQIASSTMEGLRDHIFPLLNEVKEDPKTRTQFNWTMFYRQLSPLENYYQEYGDTAKANDVAIMRGWSKSNSTFLVPNCIQRFFLKVWGTLTSFGTDVLKPTSILLGIIGIIFLVSFFELQGKAPTINSVFKNGLKYLTISKHQENDACFIQMALESIWLIYFPMYLSYLVSFFSNLR